MGRPPKYKTAKELQAKFEEYTLLQEDEEYPELTITGVCYFLGFESRQSFYRMEKKDEFKYTIKRIRLFIESQYEKQLQHKNVAGAIFALKNFGWIDTQSIDHTSKGEKISPINITVSNDEQRGKLSDIAGTVNEAD